MSGDAESERSAAIAAAAATAGISTTKASDSEPACRSEAPFDADQKSMGFQMIGSAPANPVHCATPTFPAACVQPKHVNGRKKGASQSDGGGRTPRENYFLTFKLN